jgi:hypothetical protein
MKFRKPRKHPDCAKLWEMIQQHDLICLCTLQGLCECRAIKTETAGSIEPAALLEQKPIQIRLAQ